MKLSLAVSAALIGGAVADLPSIAVKVRLLGLPHYYIMFVMLTT